jgi:hypothetical protein
MHIISYQKKTTYDIKLNKFKKQILKFSYTINAYHHWSCEYESPLGKVYPIHYVIKFVCDLRQVDGFLRALWFPPPIKLTAMI